MLVPDDLSEEQLHSKTLRKINLLETTLYTSKKLAESSHYHSEMRDSMKVIARKLLACVSPLGQTLTSTE